MIKPFEIAIADLGFAITVVDASPCFHLLISSLDVSSPNEVTSVIVLIYNTGLI